MQKGWTTNGPWGPFGRFLRLAGLTASCLISAAAGSGESRAEFALVRAAADSTLLEDPAGALANGSGPAIFAGRINSASRSIRRALIAFDVAAAVPPGSTVTAARLWLNLSGTSAGAVRVTLHSVLAAWGEGASSASGGGGAPAVDGDSTWIHRFYPAIPWTTPGGDFDPVPRGAALVDQPGLYTWELTPELVADVQLWIDRPEAAFGWMLIGDESRPQTVKRFDSKENEEAAYRPILEVTYVPPCNPDPAGPGFWRRQCAGLPGAAATDPRFADSVLPCANRILGDLGLHGIDACGALLAEPPPRCEDRAATKLSVLLLNVCAGRLQSSCPVAPAEGDCLAATIGDLLEEVAALLRAGDCRRAAACAAIPDHLP